MVSSVGGKHHRVFSVSGVKLLYARIALTKYTRFFFISSLISCLVLVALQVLTYTDNTQAIGVLDSIISQTNTTKMFPIVTNGVLRICNGLPKDAGTTCQGPPMLSSAVGFSGLPPPPSPGDFLNPRSLEKRKHPISTVLSVTPVIAADGRLDGLNLTTNGQSSYLNIQCVQSLTWLTDVFRDDQREDVVTLLFRLWVLSLSVTAIANESIPHLGASLAGHILGTAWAGFRVLDTNHLHKTYKKVIVSSKNGTCNGVDILGSWWNVRLAHAIPILAINAISLALAVFFAVQLFKVYKRQSFSRVGTNSKVHRAHKAVLFLTMILQLAAFFSVASMGIWIGKILTPNIKSVTVHLKIYLAAFVVIVFLTVPWIVFGTISIRRERGWMFIVFAVISMCVLTVYTFMFASPLYVYIFETWPFFATMTVTSYFLIVVACVMGAFCRMQFGRGLAQFLQAIRALEDADFTPVYFTADPEKSNGYMNEKDIPRWSVMPGEIVRPIHVDLPSTLPGYTPPELLYTAQTAPSPLSRGKSVSFVDSVVDIGRPPSATLAASSRERVNEMPKRPESRPSTGSSQMLSDKNPRTITPPVPASRVGLPNNPKPLNRSNSSASSNSSTFSA